MADDRDIYDAIAAALADVREPDLTRFTPAAIREAMDHALRRPDARVNFVEWLRDRVKALSAGRVSVEPRPSASPDSAAEVTLRVLIRDEPFAESAVLRADDSAVHYPMRD